MAETPDIRVNYQNMEQQKTLYWYLTDDYKHEDKFTISNKLSNSEIILEKSCVDYNEISTVLKKLHDDSPDFHFQFRIPIHKLPLTYRTFRDPENYDIYTVVCKKGEEYFLKHEFAGIDYECSVDDQVNKLLPTYLIDKLALVEILTEILKHKAELDAEREKQKKLELKAQFNFLARKQEQLKSKLSNDKHISKEVLDEIEQQLDKCLKKLSS